MDNEYEARLTRIEKVLETQVMLAARVDGRVGNVESRLDKFEQNMADLAGAMLTIARTQQRIDESIEKVFEVQKRTDERLENLTLAQAQTQNNLNALIHVVDEWIRERRGTPPTT